MGSIDHMRLEKLKIRDVSVASLKLDHLLDFSKLSLRERAIGITVTMNQYENLLAFFPAVFASQPARRLYIISNREYLQELGTYLRQEEQAN